MRVAMLLCDHAQVAENKLFVNGAGWDRCGAPTPPHSVAMLVSVPWGSTNVVTEYVLRLFHEDGGQVSVGGTPVEARGSFEVGRPTGVPPGSSLSVPLVVNVGTLPLPPGTGFVWRLTIADRSEPEWSLPFRTLG